MDEIYESLVGNQGMFLLISVSMIEYDDDARKVRINRIDG